jgi:hypothetical protein
MPSLRELQARFYEAVVFDDPTALAGLVRAPAAEHRIDVYRNNAREAFRKALAADYPVIERLVGGECFRGLARHYMREHPSRSGDLQGYGHEFAAFLAGRYGDGPHDYLADVARLEWAYQEVLGAPDASPIAVERLAAYVPEELETLRLRLHPALRLVRSGYPILRIWQLNQPDADPQSRIDLASGGDAVLVRRLPDHVELRRLESGDYALLDALRAGAGLAAAVDCAVAAAPDFDLEHALARAFTRGLVVACTLPTPDRLTH